MSIDREVFQYGLIATWHRPVCRLSRSVDAFLSAGKRSTRKAAVVLNRVPAGLDAAHVGFIFTDVMGSGHCGTSASSHRPSLTVGKFLPTPKSLLQVLNVPTDGTGTAN
jgi:hypothetical protein